MSGACLRLNRAPIQTVPHQYRDLRCSGTTAHQVTEQMKRFNADIGAFHSTLQKTPEVLQFARVNCAINVGLGMVDYLVRVLAESVVRLQGIGVDLRPCVHVLANNRLQASLTAIPGHFGTDLAGLSIEQSEYDSFSHRPTTAHHLIAFASVHVTSFLPMKVSSASMLPDILSMLPVCMACRMRWSMNHAVRWVTCNARDTS